MEMSVCGKLDESGDLRICGYGCGDVGLGWQGDGDGLVRRTRRGEVERAELEVEVEVVEEVVEWWRRWRLGWHD